jgi:hypothetical protein
MGIWPDRVQIDLEPSDIEALSEYKDVPVERWRPDPPSFWDRLFRRR